MVSELKVLLNDEQVEKLQPLAITKVVDLVGALESDEKSLGKYLSMDADEVDELHRKALDCLPENLRKYFIRNRDASYSYGALDPKDDLTK